MDELKEQIRARIEELIKNRDLYIIEANKQAMAFNAVIQELQHLLNGDAPDEEAHDDS